MITLVLLFIFAVLALIMNLREENGNWLTFTFCAVMCVAFGCAIFSHEENMTKVKLPEKIYEAKTGDTLIIQKRTKDSIYLEYETIQNNN